MPTNDNNQPNTTPENTTPDAQDDAEAGDILEQLKADAASLSNLYKLETKMLKSITNLDKNVTKQQKTINQAKKGLDSVVAAFKTLTQDTGIIKTAVSSVDTNLQRILSVLEQAGGNLFSGSTSGNYGSSSPGSLTLEQKLRQETEALAKAVKARDEGDDSQETAEMIDDLQESIDNLTEKLKETYSALVELTGDYRGYTNAVDKFEQDKNNLIDRFADNEIDYSEFRDGLSELANAFVEHSRALDKAEKLWKSDDKFSFAQDARDLKKEIEELYDLQKTSLIERYQHADEEGNFMDPDEFLQQLQGLTQARDDALKHAESRFGITASTDALEKIGTKLDGFLSKFSSGETYDPRTSTNRTASEAVETLGSIGGELASDKLGTAIGTAIGGPMGAVVGGVIGDFIGSKIEDLSDLIGDHLDYLVNHSRKTRDEILKAGFEKIRSDVKDMATYSIEIYESSTKSIYAAWDKNLGQITATQGYTKEALNSLQDAVAQRLQSEGYGNVVDASQYLDQLANTLNANLGGQLAEAFAAQNLILQKAVPEVDLSASAAQFAAIYANANKETGTGEQTMIAAMNEIAGTAKALESVTEGNNQFLKETSTLLNKATEVVQIAGGNADQISKLTSQMMASEAAITSVAPQLSGFTSELVSVLMSNNDANAVALRAIMNDLDDTIGVSATSFMKSFMEDTQGTLSTAFSAIQKFIDQNENDASRQEFLQAMETVFGVNGAKLAQIDFSSVADMIARVDTSINMAALTNAENLVRSGETTTVEEQLLANSTNQLLATNAISSTLDNKLMRKLENNELTMERLVYAAQATQSVDLAENTLGFFTKISDLLLSIIDPLGIFDMVSTSINAATSAIIDTQKYVTTASMSAIGSAVADRAASDANTFANTIGGAAAAILAAETKSTDAMVAAVESSGVSPTFQSMMSSYADSAKAAQEIIAQNSAESNIISYAALERQARQTSEYQQKQDEAMIQEARYEEEKAAAREQQRIMQEAESIRDMENHDNIAGIRDSIGGLNMSEYLEPILSESRVHTDQFKDMQAKVDEVVKLISTIIEYNMTVSPEFASTISYDEQARIMDNGYVNSGARVF